MLCPLTGRIGIVSLDTVLFFNLFRAVIPDNLYLRDERSDEIAFPAIQCIEVVAIHRRFRRVSIFANFCGMNTTLDGDGLAIFHKLHAHGVEFGNSERRVNSVLIHNLISFHVLMSKLSPHVYIISYYVNFLQI